MRTFRALLQTAVIGLVLFGASGFQATPASADCIHVAPGSTTCGYGAAGGQHPSGCAHLAPCPSGTCGTHHGPNSCDVSKCSASNCRK